ncbi:DUF1254 domain-containing protein [Ensifer soli]|uniref:DUF1254 domain-containing protein n=1 Tax=Ciceribacter sp. sgz301302 TaxID=3342379 RepID=UPI0035BB2663
MRSLLLAVAIGLVGAALLHIVIILALPSLSARDAHARVFELYEMDSFFQLTRRPGPTGLSNGDPFLRVAVCGYSVKEGPVRFYAEGPVPLWSLGVFDSRSNEVFSMNDRTAVDRRLDLVVATPAQLVALRKSLPPGLEKSILVEHADDEGFAVLRALAPTESYEEEARQFLTEAVCEPLLLEPQN